MTESDDSYELSMVDATHNAGLRFFAGVACFSDHASKFRSLRERPELWPVLENGARRPQMEWYIGMSPTDRRRQEETLSQIRVIARTFPIDGLFLDFVRWPLHWEIELRAGRDRPRCAHGRSVHAVLAAVWIVNKLEWTIEYSGLTGPALAAHFHGPAPVGKAAPVEVPLQAALDSPMKGSATLTDPQEKDLLAGLMYFNIHTEANKPGEIRGQIEKAM